MQEIKIHLNSIGAVKEFSALMNKVDTKVSLISGRYAADARSIMGILSLDLSRAIDVRVDGKEPENFREIIREYLVS